ncbi:MAG: NADH-quinone oxidoreductase subunit C [Candidatus Omnitrophota bacterium]
MSLEEGIVQELSKKFPYLEGNIKITRPRRLFLALEPARLEAVLAYALKNLGFLHLLSITGLDEQDNLSFIYHLSQDSGVVLNLKTSVSKNHPVIKTITKYFSGADIYERELMDLFGAEVEGLPAGNRYPLADDWPAGQFPLRKDWKQAG